MLLKILVGDDRALRRGEVACWLCNVVANAVASCETERGQFCGYVCFECADGAHRTNRVRAAAKEIFEHARAISEAEFVIERGGFES